MMGTQPRNSQAALFSYGVDLERRIPAEHLLRRVAAVLDLSFVIPTVRHCYGRSGNVSLDPELILKLMLLLFLYNVASERELMEQLEVRLDFLWFLGFDLETKIPDHSVLSKARARWGEEVFEKLFIRMVQQCVEAGLVNGSLLHVDSTIIKASASKDSVVSSGPELVNALRQAYQQQQSKLEVLPAPAAPQPSQSEPTPANGPVAQEPAVLKVSSPKLPVNSTHISTTDPEAQLARNKSGVTELNYKEHRLVDDAHGVITAVEATHSNVGDGSQLPGLYEQHVQTTGLEPAQVTVAGDHHYGSASNYIYCEQQGLRAHLAQTSANLEERGKLPLSQFVYEPELDRLRCPAGHYLILHQDRPEEQAKVYLIEAAAHCANCVLRAQCTQSKRGRSIQRHVQAALVEKARAQASSPAAKYSRKRRRHVMEGSFADAFNNHGARKARWRGLARQRIQSWLIAAVQNLRVLLRHQSRPKPMAAVAIGAAMEVFTAAPSALISSVLSQLAEFQDVFGAPRRTPTKSRRHLAAAAC
jgi:transposase